jgi:hypothetical protein
MIVSFVYEDEVSSLFLKEFNKRVKADIQAEEVNLSLLKRFPNATVELENFELYSAKTDSDKEGGSLSFVADHIFFQFDVIDLFTGNYKFEKVFVNHAQFNYSPNGDQPLVDYKKEASQQMHFNIEQMVFNDLYYSLLNESQNFFLEGHSTKTRLSGDFGLDRFNLEVDSRMFVRDLTIDNFTYTREKNVRLQMNLAVTPEMFRVNSGTCYYENIPFHTAGEFNRENQLIDVELRGRSLNVDDLQLYLPWNLKSKLKYVTVDDGDLDFFARINGPVNDGKPDLEADFSLRKGRIRIDQERSYVLQNIALEGYLTNGRRKNPQTSQLSLTNLHAEMGKSQLDGQVRITDFSEPQMSSEGHMKLYLNQFSGYTDKELFNSSSGMVELNYKYSDLLHNLNHLDESLRFGNLTFDAAFSNLSMEGGDYSLSNLNGFAYLNRDLHMDNVEMFLNGNRVVLDGKIFNIYQNLTDSTRPFHFEARLFSPAMDFQSLFNAGRAPRDSVVHFRFPEKLRGEVDFALEQLAMRHFTARRVKGTLHLGDQQLKLTDTEFRAFDGKAYARADMKKQSTSDNLFLDSKFYLEKVNIRQAFDAFNNFGQQYITNRNLKGSLSGEVAFSTQMNRQLKIQKNSVYNVSDIEIDNGELIEFEPLMSLSNFVELNELRHVTFSRLSNQITIEDQTVRIPEMSINSSSYDIQVSGYHTFDNRFSYDVSLLLSQVLSKKARQRNSFESEFGNIQEDGVGRSRLYLKIEGTPEQYAIEYDKEGLKDKIREDLRSEKRELKQILNEEFGWFRKDTALKQARGSEEKKQFDIQWEEDQGTPKQKKASEKQKDSGFIIKFEEDTLK